MRLLRLSGTPTVTGSSTLLIDVSDSRGVTSSASYSITIAAAPADACGKPSSVKLSSGSGTVTAVSSSSVTIGTQKLALNSCTTVRFKNKASALQVGQTVDWSGWPVSGNFVAKDLNVLR